MCVIVIDRCQINGNPFMYILHCTEIINLERIRFISGDEFDVTNHNCSSKIKSRLKAGNACYHSVQNLLSSSFLSKKLRNEIYKTLMLPVVLYGSETWSLTLREECRLRVFGNRVLRRIFGPKRGEVTEE